MENCLNLQRFFKHTLTIMIKKLLILPITAALLGACGNGNGDNATALKNDSIMRENIYLNGFIDRVAWSMDSLVRSEGMLLKPAPEGTPLSRKEQFAANLKAFEALVKRQHERIDELEKSLEETNLAHAQSMKKIISGMKQQLAEKDREIAVLKEELNSKNFSIERLESLVASLNNNVAELTETTKTQKATIVAQADEMNEAYVLIGTKKELKAAGALSASGLFSKAKLQASDFDKSKFKKVDIRNYSSVKINGKKVKVLTPSPADSYTITDNGDGTSTLAITNAKAFWGVSNYLVIQVK